MAQARYTQQSLFDNVGLSPTRATNVRPTQFAGMQAAAQFETTRANVKNRLAKMLDPIATSYIENEALKYSAENPVTQKQLDDITGKGDVSDLEGNDFTVRGKILKKLRASQVSNQLLTQAKTEMLKMLPGIESGDLSYDKVLQQANEIIDGYTGTVGKLDPEVAIKFRASAASLGNTLYQKSINLTIQRNQALALTDVNKGIENAKLETITTLNNNIKEYDPNTPKILKSLEQAQLNAIASANINPSQIPVLSQKLKNDIKTVKIDAIANYINSNDFYPNLASFEKLEKLKKLDAGSMSELFGQLDNKDRKEIENQFLNQITDIEARKESDLKKDIKVKEEEFENLIVELDKAKNDPYMDQEKIDQIKNKMLNLKTNDGNSFVTRKEIEKYILPKGATLSEKEKLEQQINDGVYTTQDEIKKQAFSIKANATQMQGFFKLLRSEVAKEEKQIENLILGITSEGISIGMLDSSTTRQRIEKAKRVLFNFEKSEINRLKEKFNRFEFLNNVYTNLYDKDGTLKTEVDSKYETLRKSLIKNPMQEMKNY